MESHIEAMALAIVNQVRAEHDLPPLPDLSTVEDPDHYRRQANAALNAYLNAK